MWFVITGNWMALLSTAFFIHFVTPRILLLILKLVLINYYLQMICHQLDEQAQEEFDSAKAQFTSIDRECHDMLPSFYQG